MGNTSDVGTSSRTVQKYLSDEAAGNVNHTNDSLLALRVKAVTLYERAARVASKNFLNNH